MKLKIPGTPSIAEWLGQVLPKNSIVGMDGWVNTIADIRGMKEELEFQGLKLELGNDPAKQLWEGRPALPDDQIEIHPLKFAGETDAVLTLGMKPTRPETGYGYIQADLTSNSPRNREIYRVDQFKEKPDLETAKHYISEHNFFWNAGIFVWSVETIVNALRVYAPRINNIFERIQNVMGTPLEQETINKVYPDCDNISIDYAVMENAEEIFVFPADFGWSDLGTWGSLLLQSQRDMYGNGLIGKNIHTFECRNCVVHTTQEKKVILQGLDGYIVAEHDDTLLVCKLSEEQRIKQFQNN